MQYLSPIYKISKATKCACHSLEAVYLDTIHMYNILDEYPTTFQALKSPQPVVSGGGKWHHSTVFLKNSLEQCWTKSAVSWAKTKSKWGKSQVPTVSGSPNIRLTLKNIR